MAEAPPPLSLLVLGAPDALVDASSALPFGHDKGAAPNNADRGVLLDTVLASLADSGRLADTRFIIVGGQLVPEPGGTINTFVARVLEFLLRYVIAPGPWAAGDRAVQRLWASPPSCASPCCAWARCLKRPRAARCAVRRRLAATSRGPQSRTMTLLTPLLHWASRPT
jgi:hypothetical protein